MSILPMHRLAGRELSRLGHNTAAAARHDRRERRTHDEFVHLLDDSATSIDEQVLAAMRSEHVAA